MFSIINNFIGQNALIIGIILYLISISFILLFFAGAHRNDKYEYVKTDTSRIRDHRYNQKLIEPINGKKMEVRYLTPGKGFVAGGKND